MSVTTLHPEPTQPLALLSRCIDWLDRKGRKAWWIAMIAGFVFFWPLGLVIMTYMIWSKRMFCKSARHPKSDKNGPISAAAFWKSGVMQSSGNLAFDNYKAETLRRLEEEQENFQDFMRRLRESKDKAEFDQFMQERARQAEQTAPEA